MPSRPASLLAPPRPWTMPPAKLKNYPHFDSPLSAAGATDLATDPVAVAAHAFHPLLLFDDVKRYFRRPDRPRKAPKKRPIRYAARTDAYIYTRYRDWLSCLYEERLAALGLSDAVAAYRRIPSPYRRGNKCNIDFAYDAIGHIRRLGDCHTLCLDIKGFFESLDHARLKAVWASLLGVRDLPPDHYRVFRSVTKYVEVDQIEVYRRLGFWGEKTVRGRRDPVEGFLVDRRRIPIRLCDARVMREVVFGEGGRHPKIAVTRKERFGIPQGTPISDLLANIYMLDFDRDMKELATGLGGHYSRYSDDILFVVPADAIAPGALAATVASAITLQGDELKIADGKTAIHRFTRHDGELRCASVSAGSPNKRFEYLGFRFDGRRVHLRDSTLSVLRQKIAGVVRREAIAQSRRYASWSVDEICDRYDYRRIEARFGRVREFEAVCDKADW
ncbi:reverse transcriptase domain-containing protein [Aureimonas leprariae]|uniref:Reverse transcriptase n=1 Tax=Plantimonas leprariae TaxID=2615207 RepID=A0A7V7TVY4_9HYPH|nr:reverse transcriptase domain-containing protein [Aureimonas leprariae]KAB0679058.1 reverse transcriptase [Aureimonas leprariae]